jgi:hypothetical protein
MPNFSLQDEAVHLYSIPSLVSVIASPTPFLRINMAKGAGTDGG